MMNFIIDHSGIIGLLFFVAFFLAIAILVFNPRKVQEIESHKLIPLMEDDHELR